MEKSKGWQEFACGWGAAFINITVTYPINKVMFRQVSLLHNQAQCRHNINRKFVSDVARTKDENGCGSIAIRRRLVFVQGNAAAPGAENAERVTNVWHVRTVQTGAALERSFSTYPFVKRNSCYARWYHRGHPRTL